MSFFIPSFDFLKVITMKTNPSLTPVNLALLLACGLFTQGSALAQSDVNARIQQLEQQLKQLKDQVEASAKENVVVGDAPGSLRIPNTESSVRIYGIAELNMVREGRGDNSNNDYSTFLPYAPLNGSAAAKKTGRNYLHARTSRLGLEAAAPSPWGQVSAKVEGDFNNDPRLGNSSVSGDIANLYTQQVSNSYGFRLRHAYLQVGGWMVGQNWSTFMDIDNTPETVDFNGPIGATFVRQPQVRYTYVTPQTGNYTVALENSLSYVYDKAGSAMDAGFSRTPDLVLRWDRGFPWGSLNVRAVSHEIKLNDGDGLNTAQRGTGFGVSGQIKTGGDDFISWLITGGTGIGRYFNYVEGAGYNDATNKIELEKVLGLVVGYQKKFNDQYRMNLVYGEQKSASNGYTAWANTHGLGGGQYGFNRKVQQLHVGGFWNPIKAVEVGAEYIWGQRKTLAGEKGDMSRINLLDG
jgi:hypothetical protein